jgi:hypothetical protein
MRWEDERYVRLYTRDTVDWEMLPWQSRALFPLLLRKVDRAGIIQLGKHGARGLSNVVGLPVEVTEAGLAGLLDDGSAEIHGESLVIKNFIEAQEATASDSKRAREYRERHRNVVTNRDTDITNRDATVTGNHDASRAVTTRHSVPSLTVPSLTDHTPAQIASPAAPLVLVPTGKDADFDLDAVYDEYPRKIGRTAGIKALKKQIKTAADYAKVMQGVVAFAVAMKSEGRPVLKIPYFSSWVNQEQWRDYAELPIEAFVGGAAAKSKWREPMPHQQETVDETDKL